MSSLNEPFAENDSGLWPKFWKVAFAVAIPLSVVAVLFAFLWHRVTEVPDIGEPFDVQAFVSVSVPPGKNAFTVYRAAQAKLIDLEAAVKDEPKRTDAEKSEFEALEKGWSAANGDVRSWLETNREALELWKGGTDRSEAMAIPPTEVTIYANLSLTNSGREFVRLAMLEAARLNAEKRAADAWRWYRASLRAGRHFCFHACSIQRLVGAAIQAIATDSILRWSAQPELTAADLRVALADTISIDRLAPPLSDFLKAQYLSMGNDADTFLNAIGGKSIHQWTGERERIRRLMNLLLANWLSQADRPRFQRTPVHSENPFLFELDPTAMPDSKLLSPVEITEWCGVAGKSVAPDVMFFRLLGQSIGSVLDAVDREEVRRSAVVLVLALRLYQLEHGRFPATLDELIKAGHLTAIPADPFGKGESMHYRPDADPRRGALLWSVWVDGTDQEGKVEAKNVELAPGDKVFRIAVPLIKSSKKHGE